ncbi:hypothetical protein I317_06039 [Kwoniella heveanensis CBS 569]|uniref:Uncharacterized protein n=1 Tax=Kwoniella heveanensis BCC8398 TaxID=1296120 RepID=A0A1B9GW94_9TREE|nr:hypothetical protein I316_02835 [Kwoniella heveanensis BCC8398]OCF40150.1 hypothetical protein I317_06039 [Kwoniella heveanensis CBS 569]
MKEQELGVTKIKLETRDEELADCTSKNAALQRVNKEREEAVVRAIREITKQKEQIDGLKQFLSQVNEAREKECTWAAERFNKMETEWTAKLASKDEEGQRLPQKVQLALQEKETIRAEVARFGQELESTNAIL